MKDAPPQDLVDLLAELGLARAEHVYAVRSRVRRLAKDLPGFESVWVDALAQARILTPFQAAELNAGRGRALGLGPYVLHQPLPSPGYARVYRAYERAGQRWVRLSVISTTGSAAEELSNRLRRLVHLSSGLTSAHGLLPVFAHGADRDRVWAASPDVRGQTAGEWGVHHGRFPPAAVLEIAQQMLAALLVCEQGNLLHGDLRPGQLLLDSHGKAWLPEPGLRLAVRPDEGFAHADLPPEAYECLAPERVAVGGKATTAADLYACGCIWWHLLAGRPAIPGATGLAKLRAGQTARIAEVRSIAPDASPALAEAIADCLRRSPQHRPDSIGRLALRLATPSAAGRNQLVRSVRRSCYGSRRASTAAGVRRAATRWPRLAVGAVAVTTVLVGVWPYWGHWWRERAESRRQTASVKSNSVAILPRPLPDGEATAMPGGAAESPAAVADIALAAWDEPLANVLELETGKPLQLIELALRPGMTVRGRAGQRALLQTPSGGLAIDVEDVRFENIDFISGSDSASRRGHAPALVCLRAYRATFSHCSFQSASSYYVPGDQLPSAIAWLGKPLAEDAELSLPTGELALDHCVFRAVSAAVYCQIEAALVFELTSILHLGPGPVAILSGAPRADEPITLAMKHLTLRNAASLLECRYGSLDDNSGGISVQADDCAFVPAIGGGLLVFKGAAHPGPLVERLDWSGQGSVLSREAPVALWHGTAGRIRAAAEDMIQIAGLVRTAVGFAGEAEAGPAASRIVRWQVPLHSADPPGIDGEGLSLPDLRRD